MATDVLDIGVNWIRVGPPGEVNPEQIIPTVIGLPRIPHKLPLRDIGLFPINPTEKLDNTSIVYPFKLNDDQAELDEQALEALIKGLRNESLIHGPHILVSEPDYLVRKYKEILGTILFEKYDTESLLFSKSSVLNLFANARTSGIALDLGYLFNRSVAVNEGIVVAGSLQLNYNAGKKLTDMFRETVKDVYIPTKFQHNHQQPYPFVDPTYAAWSQTAVIDEILFPRDDSQSALLPDGCQLVKYAEIAKQMKIKSLLDGTGNLVETLFSKHTDPDRNYFADTLDTVKGNQDIVNSVVISGGLSADEELLLEIERRASSYQKMVPDPFGGLPLVRRESWPIYSWGWRCIYSNKAAERTTNTWRGGSILGSLGIFTSVAISNQTYDEHGPNIFTNMTGPHHNPND